MPQNISENCLFYTCIKRPKKAWRVITRMAVSEQ